MMMSSKLQRSGVGAMLKEIWNTWDIRGLVVLSLSIQVCLTLLSPCRKRWSHFLLHNLLWILYLCADTVSLFTISKISANMSSSTQRHVSEIGNHNYSSDLLAFWAPFLLLHLGGPDTITAYSLEDNELWRRHGLQLFTQTGITLYVFFSSVSIGNYKFKTLSTILTDSLLFPTILIFLNGFIKYFERTYSLYFASADNFRNSLRIKPDEHGPNHARLLEEFTSAKDGSIPAEIIGLEDDSHSLGRMTTYYEKDDSHEQPHPTQNNVSIYKIPKKNLALEDDMILDANRYCEKFRGILAEQFLSSKDCQESREHFLGLHFRRAFRTLEIELNLIYDSFYTKVLMLHKWLSYGRVLAMLSMLASLLLFCFKSKTDYQSYDIGITFALLIGGLALDLVALFMFIVSDWMLITFSRGESRRFLQSFRSIFIRFCSIIRIWPSERWSRSLSTCNLFKHSQYDLPSCFDRFRMYPLKEILVGCMHVGKHDMEEKLEEFILEELRRKARHVMDCRYSLEKICSARGNLMNEDEYVFVSEYFSRWTEDMDYDESVMTWHLATELCYWADKQEDNINCKWSRYISDYLSYLLLRQRSLVSQVVGMYDVRFQDTLTDVKKFNGGDKLLGISYWKLLNNKLKNLCNMKSQDDSESNLKKYCQNALKSNINVPPITPKDHKSKSVYYEACYLANQLKKLEVGTQWKITAKVWVELLCFAAVRCSPRSHVAVLSKGGELVTIVWLLMVHLGLSPRFSHDHGLAWWVKLNIPK